MTTVYDYSATRSFPREPTPAHMKQLHVRTDRDMAIAIRYEGDVTPIAHQAAAALVPHGLIAQVYFLHCEDCDVWLDPVSFAPPKGTHCTCGEDDFKTAISILAAYPNTLDT
ncbi:hypothetical protein AB2L57_10730 [Microbacterium sp. HA-8]|uniref:hypothetical protein n=1 Tax=Microbacterium sp. HA-8 TaxID=3234200 RepID=UPI0038F7471C